MSTDSIYAHKVFVETSPMASRVRYPLASDQTGRVPWLYGALDPERGVAQRVSVLIDPEGRIAFYLAYPAEVGRSPVEMLRLVHAVQFTRQSGLGAPAEWLPGQSGLTRSVQRVGRV